MSYIASAIGGSAILGAGASLFASNKQSDASAAALNQQHQMYEQTRNDLAPYKNVGQGALVSLGQLYGIGADGKVSGQPYNQQSLQAFRNSPDYKFAFDQGNQALTFSNAAKGLLQSGSNLKDIVGFGQGLASQQFGNYVNRLSGLATMGQNSAAGGATNALGFAGAMGNTTLAGGQAAASGAVGAANSLTGGVGSYLGYNQQQNNNQMLMNAFGNKNNGPMDINAPGTVGGNNAVGAGTSGGNPIGLYADGGRPPVGQPAIVGERGPELFVPDQSNGGRPWHGNGWQDGDSQNGLAAFGVRQPWDQPGGQPNGLMSASRGFGGLPGFADGGRPPVGEPIVVGENGPEVVQMDQPGTVVPNHELPAWMNADTLSPAPPYSPPMTRALPGYENIAPNELATMRHQQMVRPDAGRGDFTPEHLANMVHAGMGIAGAPGVARAAMMAAPYLSAEGLAAQVATRAPALAAGGLGAVYAGAPTAAGEQEFRWSDPDQSRTKEMADIQNRINGRAAQITTLGTTKTNSPAGTQASTIKSLEALNHPDGADMKRLTELRQQAAADRQGAQEQFQYDQDRARQQAEAKRKAETSWFDVVPGSRAAIPPIAMAASYYGGQFAGKRLPMIPAMVAGAVGGGLEGALAQYGPTEMDMGLPRTAPARIDAANDLVDPSYWNRMAAMSGGNAALGAYGAFRGALGRRTPLPPIGPGSAPNMLQAAMPSPSSMGTIPPGPANGLATVSQALPSQPGPNALAAASVMRVTDKNGRTIYMNRSGGFAKKEDIDLFLNPRGQ